MPWQPGLALVFLFPEFTFDHGVVGVGAIARVAARCEPGKRRQQPVKCRFPQPGEGEKKSRRHSREQCGHMFASRQEAQQGQGEQAYDEWPARRFWQQTDYAQPAIAYPGEPCEQSAQQQARRESACAEIIGEHADDKETGVGHRAGQGCQHA